MSQQSAFWPIAGLMFATGIGIPILASINAGLAQQLGGAVAATWVAFLVGFVLISVIFVATGLPDPQRFTFERPHLYFGVVFLVFYILSVTFAAPRIGLGNAIFFVLIGQLVAAATIDHFGWLNAHHSPITGQRILGIAIMALGVYLAKRTT